MTEQTPPLNELADENDTAGWDRTVHGTFDEHATPDDTVPTMSADDYLKKFGPVLGPAGGGD